MWMRFLAAGIGLLIGALVGDFLGLLVERLPSGQVVFGPRVCPTCGGPLSVSGRLPLIRYMSSCGRCGQRAPRGALWIEGFTAIGTASVVLLRFGTWPAALIVLWLAIAATVIDLRHRIIPNRLLAGAALAGLVALIPAGPPAYMNGALGAGVLFAVGALLAVVGRGGFGFGDVKYLAVVGLLLGLQRGVVSLMLAVLLGGLYAAGLLATRKAGRKDTIAFGPFIAIGSLAVALLMR
ncbi:MAG: A24 family peptidase [Thermaerobacter sp.]|nr:A24 family peptidase [Thermaerobacter sp.]